MNWFAMSNNTRQKWEKYANINDYCFFFASEKLIAQFSYVEADSLFCCKMHRGDIKNFCRAKKKISVDVVFDWVFHFRTIYWVNTVIPPWNYQSLMVHVLRIPKKAKWYFSVLVLSFCTKHCNNYYFNKYLMTINSCEKWLTIVV